MGRPIIKLHHDNDIAYFNDSHDSFFTNIDLKFKIKASCENTRVLYYVLVLNYVHFRRISQTPKTMQHSTMQGQKIWQLHCHEAMLVHGRKTSILVRFRFES